MIDKATLQHELRQLEINLEISTLNYSENHRFAEELMQWLGSENKRVSVLKDGVREIAETIRQTTERIKEIQQLLKQENPI